MFGMKSFIAMTVASLSLPLATCGGSDLSTEDANDTKNRCSYIAPDGKVIPDKPGVDELLKANADDGACLDDRQKRAIAFPNKFANVATGCDGYGHRIFVTTRDFIDIIADPTCPGWTEDTPKMRASYDAPPPASQPGPKAAE